MTRMALIAILPDFFAMSLERVLVFLYCSNTEIVV